LAIELMAAAQAHDFLAATAPRAAGTDLVFKAVREHVSHYGDERPLNGDIEAVRSLIRETAPPL
jgi:histidine ammonia-lyase